MKKLNLSLMALLLTACYATDRLNGDTTHCREECYDGDPCTEDVCDIDDNCLHFLIPGCGDECSADLDCEDGVDCTIDYCDSAHICQQVDMCEEVCDPEMHVINTLEAIGSLDAASNGELIMLVMSGADAASTGRIDLLDPLNLPTDLAPSRRIEEDAEVRKPFVFWSEGDDPQLFWTSVSGESSTVMTARFVGGAEGLVERSAISDLEEPLFRLNDVKQSETGEFGLALEAEYPDDNPTSFLVRYTPEAGMIDSIQMLPVYNYMPVIAPSESGWSMAYTVRNEAEVQGQVFHSRYDPPASATMDQLAMEETSFATHAMISTSSAEIVLYDRYVTEEIKQLYAGWVTEDGNVVSIDLAWQTKGVDALSSYDEDSALISWCATDIATGESSVRVINFSSTRLLETVFWSESIAGCAKTELVQVNNEQHLLWLSDSGGILFHKNLSCLY